MSKNLGFNIHIHNVHVQFNIQCIQPFSLKQPTPFNSAKTQTTRHHISQPTCLNGLIAPLMRSESAAMPAMPPSLGSRSCRSDTLGAVCECAHTLCPLPLQHITLPASGCELWRMMREPDSGEPVMNTGGGRR